MRYAMNVISRHLQKCIVKKVCHILVTLKYNTKKNYLIKVFSLGCNLEITNYSSYTISFKGARIYIYNATVDLVIYDHTVSHIIPHAKRGSYY